MKQLIKKILIKILHPLIIRLGYSNTSNELNLLENFFSVLKELKFNPIHIIDVGANHGTWTKTALKYFSDSHFYLLEPQKWLEQSVNELVGNNPKVKFFNYGAGSAPGVFKFSIASRDDSSTFRLTEGEAKDQGIQQIDIEVVTLDEFTAKQNLPAPDIIKIDAEGLDLEVLKGSSQLFGKTEIFMVEAGVAAKGIENNILKVIEFMDSKGYKLFDITDLNRPFEPKILWLTELVFVKKDGFIDSKKII